MNKLFFFVLFIAGIFNLSSQIDSIQNAMIKKLNDELINKKDSIYIKTKFNDTKDIYIFLINESKDTIEIEIEGLKIEFKKEVLDKSGNWDFFGLLPYCLVLEPKFKLKIPPNYYTWEKIDNLHYFGDFETQLKISYNIAGRTLTKTFGISYNEDLFLTRDERLLKHINTSLSTNSNLPQEKRLQLLLKKSETYIKMGKLKESYILCDSLIKIKLANDQIRFSKSKSLYKYVVSNLDSFTELEKMTLVSKNIGLFNKVNSTNNKIQNQISYYLKTLNSVLITKEEFDEKFPNNNTNYFYEIDFIELEKIRMLFKKQN